MGSFLQKLGVLICLHPFNIYVHPLRKKKRKKKEKNVSCTSRGRGDICIPVIFSLRLNPHQVDPPTQTPRYLGDAWHVSRTRTSYRFTERDARTITNQKKNRVRVQAVSRVKEHGAMEAPRLALFHTLFFFFYESSSSEDDWGHGFERLLLCWQINVNVHFQGVQVATV